MTRVNRLDEGLSPIVLSNTIIIILSMISNEGPDNKSEDISAMVEPQRVHWGNNIVPNNDDVLLGRGNVHRRHPGNEFFAALISSYQEKYAELVSPLDKRAIVCEIINIVHVRGRFLKQAAVSRQWIVVTQQQTRVKVAHALQYKCSSSHGTKYGTATPHPCQSTPKDVDGKNKDRDAVPSVQCRDAPPTIHLIWGQTTKSANGTETSAFLVKHISASNQWPSCQSVVIPLIECSTRDQVTLREKPTTQFYADQLFSTSTDAQHRSTSSIGSFDMNELWSDDDDDYEGTDSTTSPKSDNGRLPNTVVTQRGLNNGTVVLDDALNAKNDSHLHCNTRSTSLETVSTAPLVLNWNTEDDDDDLRWNGRR